jgi:hypothetical protein
MKKNYKRFNLIKSILVFIFNDCCWGMFGGHWEGCKNYTGKRNLKREFREDYFNII